MTGTLTVCPTPIGNLNDVTPRQREALVSADIIACEDTRTTGKLLNLLEIDRENGRPKLVSYHDHNAEQRLDYLTHELEKGSKVTLVSDAGTPTISDPGFRLVRRAVEKEIRIVSLPGACAAIVAISASGLPTDRFVFEGFIGNKTAERQKRLSAALDTGATIVVYESAKRLRPMLHDVLKVLGDVRVSVARELTKKYESFYHGSVSEVLQLLPEPIKGECVIVIEVLETELSSDAKKLTVLLTSQGVAPKIVKTVVREHYGVSKSDVFEWIQALRTDD